MYGCYDQLWPSGCLDDRWCPVLKPVRLTSGALSLIITTPPILPSQTAQDPTHPHQPANHVTASHHPARVSDCLVRPAALRSCVLNSTYRRTGTHALGDLFSSMPTVSSQLEPSTATHTGPTSSARRTRRSWTSWEDQTLRSRVAHYGDARGANGRWKEIACGIPGRTAKVGLIS